MYFYRVSLLLKRVNTRCVVGRHPGRTRFVCVVGVSMLDIYDIVDDDREHNVGEEEEEEEEWKLVSRFAR